MRVAQVCHALKVRLLCDACGQAGPLLLVTEGDSPATVRCQHCGARAELASPGALAPEGASRADAAPDDGARCPKCRAAYGQRTACPGCGLAVARMAGFSAAQFADVPEALRQAWADVEASWDDQAQHDGFVQAVASSGAFAWGAGKYQDVCRQRPDDALAARQLARVRRTAEAAMLASAEVRPVVRAPYRNATAVLILLVLVLGAGTMYTTILRSPKAQLGTTRPAAPALRAAPAPTGR